MGDADVKILCLHGWRTNGRVMEYQIRHLKSAMENYLKTEGKSRTCRFDCLNAPLPATEAAPENILAKFGPDAYFQWWDYQKVNGRGMLLGAEDSIAYIEHHVQTHGPYTAVLGFSQGSAVVSIMNGLYLQRQVQNGQDMPWKLSIHVSGLVLDDTDYNDVLATFCPMPLPSIVLLGENDFLLQRAEIMAALYDPSMQLIHRYPEGHHFPSSSQGAIYSSVASRLGQL